MLMWITFLILAGYLIAFVMWYYFWRLERFSKGLKIIFDMIVEEWRLENPDGDIRDLRFNIIFKDEQIEFGLEEEEK